MKEKPSRKRKSEIVGKDNSKRKIYVKPEVEEHEAIKDVTTASCGRGHYWY